MKRGPKHKICRRVGSCVWGNPKCPSVKRPYPAGSAARARRRKLSTFGELLLEKQKLRTHYNLTERQLRYEYQKAQKGEGVPAEKFLKNLETRLASVVFRSGLAPSIFASQQAVAHRHVHLNGRVLDRPGARVKPGDTVSINTQRSPSMGSIAQKSDVVPPSYLDVDRQNAKVTLAREPVQDEIPVDVEVVRVIEFYAR